TFKHGRKIALASLLGRLLAARIPDPVHGDAAPLLIPVPLHRWRLWQRGFNQSGLIAQELAKREKGNLLIDGLVRRKRTPSLGGLGAKARRKTLSGAIAIKPAAAERISGRDIVLVDDVLTSGATSDACVSVLLRGGARSVTIACFARVIEGDFEQSLSRIDAASQVENTLASR
ncbi:MAG: phosphoribosyltransferase family protein, partial [Pseudomonadota bacterium]